MNHSMYLRHSLLLCILFFCTFQTNVIFAQPKSASLVLEQSFGSDPYNNFAQNQNTIVVTGTSTLFNDFVDQTSRVVDILNFVQGDFELVGQHEFRQLDDGTEIRNVVDVSFVNDHWVFLVNTASGLSLVSAILESDTFSFVGSTSLNLGSSFQPDLIEGNGNNLYVTEAFPGASFSVQQVDVRDSGEVEVVSSRSFGNPQGTSFLGLYTATFFNDELYVTLNRGNGQPADFFRLPFDENGTPLQEEQFNFPDAQQQYQASTVSGDLWFLFDSLIGMQVVRIDGNQLSSVFEQGSTFDFTRDIIVRDNLVLRIGRGVAIESFEVNTNGTLSLTQTLFGVGRVEDAELVGNTLFFTRSSQGIEALNVNPNSTTVLSSLDTFSQSADISDFDILDNRLATNALERAFHLWQLSGNQQPELESRFEPSALGAAGIEFFGDDVLVINDGQLNIHSLSDFVQGIDRGQQRGFLGASSSDGEIITLDEGFLARASGNLNFFSFQLTQVDRIEIPNSNFTIQPMLAVMDALFVPRRSPNQVIIYDTSNLSQVTEVSRINRDNFITGNLAKSGDFLYVPDLDEAFLPVINVYDVSELSNPSLVETVALPDRFSLNGQAFSLHVNGDFLVVVNATGTIFDISVPSSPILVDENTEVSTNGLGIGNGGTFFTVPVNSAGRIQQTTINLAPTHPDISLTVIEDQSGEFVLSATDNENDATSFAVSEEPIIGLIEIEGNVLRYVPDSNEFGTDTAEVEVSDIHGGTSVFTVDVTITPVNDAPVIVTEQLSASEDESTDFTIEIDDPDDTEFEFLITEQPTSGNAILSDEGVLTYSPNVNFNGDDSITIQVTDQAQGTDTRTLAIIVLPANDAPIYEGDVEATADEDSAFTINLAASDIDGDSVSFGIAQVPPQWEATIEGDVLEVMPEANANGEFIVVINVDDGTQAVQQEINVNLTAINDSPTVLEQNIALSVVEGQTVSSSVSAEDVDEGDELTFSLSANPTQGTAVVNQDGTFTYTANAGTSGTDNFMIDVTDVEGASVTVAVTVNVSAPPPEANSNSGGGGSIEFWHMALILLVLSKRRILTIQRR